MAGRAEMEREATATEDVLERKVRELPGSEQPELQNLERARGLDRGGPSRVTGGSNLVTRCLRRVGTAPDLPVTARPVWACGSRAPAR